MLTRSTRLFALALFLLYAISIVGWHAIDTRPSSMDETRHMKLALDYKEWLIKGVPLTNEWSRVYPPLYHIAILPALSMGVPTEGKVAATHLLDLLVFIAGCMLLGRAYNRSDWESLLGAFLGAGYCYVLWASRRALIDFPLMAWVTFSIALLARTQGFSSRRSSLIWGAATGVGLLIKAPFIFFCAGPIVWVLAIGLRDDSLSRVDRIKNFAWAGALALMISVPWYFWQGAYFFDKAFRLAAEPTAIGTDPHTLSGWLFYLRLLPSELGVWSLLFTGLGIAFACWRRVKGIGLIGVWAVSSYVVLTLLINKDPRHILPMLPALALLAAYGWGSFFSKDWKAWAIAAAGPLLMLFNMATYDQPAREEWQHGAMLAYMVQHHDPAQPMLLASILSHHPRFFSRTMKWSAIQRTIDLNLVSPGDSDTSFSEFILIRPGDQGSETEFLNRQWQDLHPESRAFTALFSIGTRYELPDHSQVILYQRTAHPSYRIDSLTPHAVEKLIDQAMTRWMQGPLKVTVDASPAELKEGRLNKVVMSCRGCEIKGVRVESVQVVVRKPWLNLYRLADEHRLGLLAFESLQPTLKLTAADVVSRLSGVKGLEAADVQMQAGKLRISGRFKKISVRATAHVERVDTSYPHLVAVLDRLWVAGIPLPGWLLGKAHRQNLPLYPIPDFPGRILVHQIRIDDGQLQIS